MHLANTSMVYRVCAADQNIQAQHMALRTQSFIQRRKPASRHFRMMQWHMLAYLLLLALALLEVHPGGLPLLGGHIHVMEPLLGLIALLQLLLLLLGLLIVCLLDLQPLRSTQCITPTAIRT